MSTDPFTPTPDDTDADTDLLGDELRSHFRRRATSVHAPMDTPTAWTTRREAAERTASRHHRRVAGAAFSGAAAVAVAVALVINAQAPQQVAFVNEAAGPAPVAGVATGSSTGSATGAAKGWKSDMLPVAPDPQFRPVTLADTDAEPDFANAWVTRRGSGRPAPELAVLADLEVGRPVRFVIASPQRSQHLTDGTGGTTTTIDGRPARIIRGNHGWHQIIWSIDEQTNVFVQAYGLTFDEVANVAATLTEDGDGRWTMDTGDLGLTTVDTTPPESQRALTISWERATDSANGESTNLHQTDGGDYEFWAAMRSWAPSAAELEATEIGLGDGTTTTGVLFSRDGGEFGWARLTALDPSGTVFHVERSTWRTTDDEPVTATVAPSDSLRAAAPTLFRRLDDAEWAALLARAVERTEAQQRAGAASSDEDPGGLAASTTTTVPAEPPATTQPPATTPAGQGAASREQSRTGG